MVDNIQPLQNRVAIVNPDGTPTDFFIRWAKQRQIDISGGITAAQAQALIDAWALARDVTAGVGLDGGGNLSADITINLEDTAVTPGVYGDATNIPQITVDQQGRITDVVDIPAAGGGGSLEIEDEGVSVETNVTKINFTGAGVTATNPAAGEVDVTIPGGGMTLIEEYTVTAGGGDVSKIFSAIPATYNCLKLVLNLNGTNAVAQNIQIRINGDVGANYNFQQVTGANAAASAAASATATFMNIGSAAGAAGALFPSQTIIDFINYTDTNRYKACVGISYCNFTTAIADGRTRTVGGTWRDIAALNSIEIFLSAGNLAQNSYLALYGY